MKFDEIIGNKYGKITITKIITEKGAGTYCETLCDCGNKKTIYINSVISGKTQSCGCLNRKLSSERLYKHGLKKENLRLYQIWENMRARF